MFSRGRRPDLPLKGVTFNNAVKGSSTAAGAVENEFGV
jgi:hypothetical protein